MELGWGGLGSGPDLVEKAGFFRKTPVGYSLNYYRLANVNARCTNP